MTLKAFTLWLPRKLRVFAIYFWATIQQSAFPIWLALLGAVIGGMVTWYGIPGINQQLEFQRMRASYLTKMLDELNATSSEYIGYVTQIKALRSGDQIPPELLGNEARIGAQLVWHANDLAVVLKESGQPEVRNFQIALNDLKTATQLLPSDDDRIFEEKILTFLGAAHALSARLADFAQLRP